MLCPLEAGGYDVDRHAILLQEPLEALSDPETTKETLMTISTSFTTSRTGVLVGSGPSKSRSYKRLGAVVLAVSLLFGSGVAFSAQVAAQSEDSPQTAPSLFVAIKGYRALDTRIDGPGKIDDGPITVGVFTGRGKIMIPPEAVAVAYTITVTATDGSGFAYVDTYGDQSEISTVAWTGPGQRVVNSGIVQTFEGDTDGAHLVQVGVGGTDAAAHVIIDITGYLVPGN